ncbi:MAG TPA: response regulator [Polyangia bacterium]
MLVVDDDPLITRMLARVLKGHHTVRFAAGPSDALVAVEQRVPDVLLCDFLVEGGTAAELLRQVKRRWPAVRCVLHTASRPERWAPLVAERIVDQVVPKPSSIHEILAALSA